MQHRQTTPRPELPCGTPLDYAEPNWAGANDGDWQDFVADDLRVLWPTFSDGQKGAIARMAAEFADLMSDRRWVDE